MDNLQKKKVKNLKLLADIFSLEQVGHQRAKTFSLARVHSNPLKVKCSHSAMKPATLDTTSSKLTWTSVHKTRLFSETQPTA